MARSTEKSLRISILPMGTANLIATALGIPEDLVEALNVAVKGSTKRIDIGKLDEHYFLLGIGIGATESFIRNTDSGEKKRLGKFAYVKSLIESTRDPVFSIEVESDGRKIETTGQAITLANYWGTNGVDALDNTRDDDGKMECVINRRITTWSIIRLALLGILGDIRADREVQAIAGTRFKIRTDPAMPIQLDGSETETKTPVEVEILHQALEVSIPG
jgi:diacylglycerol kinase family enzyme